MGWGGPRGVEHARARNVRERATLGKRWAFLHAAGAGEGARFRTTASGGGEDVQEVAFITPVIITVLPGTAKKNHSKLTTSPTNTMCHCLLQSDFTARRHPLRIRRIPVADPACLIAKPRQG